MKLKLFLLFLFTLLTHVLYCFILVFNTQALLLFQHLKCRCKQQGALLWSVSILILNKIYHLYNFNV